MPPLITDIDLSLDDKFLYVSCWGTGKLLQYDVSDPFNPVQTGEVEMGGVVRKAAHPTGAPLSGGPQMVEISRDGRRVYLTNSLYSTWDDQFYPDGLNGWLSLIDVNPEGGIAVQPGILYRLWQVTGAPGEVAGRRRFFGYLLLPVGVLFALTSPPRVAWAGSAD